MTLRIKFYGTPIGAIVMVGCDERAGGDAFLPALKPLLGGAGRNAKCESEHSEVEEREVNERRMLR